MTAEFNITIPGAEIIKRLTDLEAQNVALTNRLAAVEELPFIPRTVATVNYVDEQLEVLSRHLHGYMAERHQALADRVKQLEDGAGWSDGKHMENATAPVDTSWHPYDVLIDGDLGRPYGDKRVMVLYADNNGIQGPYPASRVNWEAMGGGTIVAWRYAKAGE